MTGDGTIHPHKGRILNLITEYGAAIRQQEQYRHLDHRETDIAAAQMLQSVYFAEIASLLGGAS